MADKGGNSRKALIEHLNRTLADHFALYFKTKSYHWHVKGPQFRDLHLLFDEQATAIFGVTDVIAERVRKLDAGTLTSVGAIAEHSTIKDDDRTDIDAKSMIKALGDDNAALVDGLKALKEVADEAGDNATSALVDEWQDAAEERVWFLRQALR